MPPILLLASLYWALLLPVPLEQGRLPSSEEHPSPERSLSTSHSNQKTRRLQQEGENPSLSLQALHPLSSLVSGASLGACDCWAGPASGLQEWTRAARLGLSCCSPTEAAANPVCTVSLRGPAPPSQCPPRLPLSPEGFGAQVKMQIKSGCF